MAQSPVFDVAVVGAGPAGSATALRLAQAGLRVALLEKSYFDQPRVGESLAPGVQPLLRNLGLWPDFCALQPLPSFGMRSVWGSPEIHEHSHLLSAWQQGWHVDRTQFDRMLAEGASRAGVDVRLGMRVRTCDAGDHFRIQSAAGSQELRARFIVDATGRGATLARTLRARHAVFDRLVAVAAHFTDPAAGAECFTLVETTADGWWYCAPVCDGRSVVMLMSDGDLVRTSRLADASAWENALERTSAISKRLKHRGRAACWRTGMIPAISQRLRRSPTSSRWLAVGDAALAVDPVSGSGVFRALQMADQAAATILAGFPSNDGPLKEYESTLDADCTDYLVERAHYYNLEQRWQSPFWQRRVNRPS